MDIYSRASKWRWGLAVAGLLFVLASSGYTYYLTEQLAEQEARQARLVVGAMQGFSNPNLDTEMLTYLTEITRTNEHVPLILVDAYGNVESGINIGESTEGELTEADRTYLTEVVGELQEAGAEPLALMDKKVYFKTSNLQLQLRYFPFIQLLLIVIFVSIAFLAYANAKRSEQNRVWVGMAKETAHQLGTPTSGILGWIEHLKMIREDDEEIQEIAHELHRDVNRLQLVAERFSKIGSKPELQAVDIYQQIEKIRDYMQPRAPRKVVFEYPDPADGPLMVNINPGLFDWVTENLLRNALDATGRKGTMSAEIYEDDDFVYVDLTDTGKGIPPGKLKTVFRPGYSTKKRGWGLGLSLAKRIIEEYHSGKIFVKKSVLNEGTTFTIQLPKPRKTSTENTVPDSPSMNE